MATLEYSTTRVRIQTLSGIELLKEREMMDYGMGFVAYGPWYFFVNGKEVDYWFYDKGDDDFYWEKIEIKDRIDTIDTPI